MGEGASFRDSRYVALWLVLEIIKQNGLVLII